MMISTGGSSTGGVGLHTGLGWQTGLGWHTGLGAQVVLGLDVPHLRTLRWQEPPLTAFRSSRVKARIMDSFKLVGD
jgi:hypothetical protein